MTSSLDKKPRSALDDVKSFGNDDECITQCDESSQEESLADEWSSQERLRMAEESLAAYNMSDEDECITLLLIYYGFIYNRF